LKLRTLLALAWYVLAVGCENSAAVNPSEAPAKKDKVEFYKVGRQKVPSYLKVTGSVQPDKEGIVRIVSPLAGSVEKISIHVGDQVSKGDPLIEIKSPDISDIQSRLIVIQSQLNEANRIYSLQQQLFDVGATAKNDMLRSEATVKELQANIDGLKNKLAIYNVPPSADYSDRFEIKAPISGYIAEIHTGIGMRPDTSAVLMTIADPAKMMVVANISDSDIAKTQKGAPLSFTTDIYPNKIFKGVVSYISDVSNPNTKTVKVYIRLPGSTPHSFKLNMFLDMKILKGEATLPVIPKTAIVYKQGKFFVYLKDGDAAKLQAITPKSDVDDKFISVEGVNEGDEIVLSAINKEKV
jgi:RND family efflux transporter MFP subunit